MLLLLYVFGFVIDDDVVVISLKKELQKFPFQFSLFRASLLVFLYFSI